MFDKRHYIIAKTPLHNTAFYPNPCSFRFRSSSRRAPSRPDTPRSFHPIPLLNSLRGPATETRQPDRQTRKDQEPVAHTHTNQKSITRIAQTQPSHIYRYIHKANISVSITLSPAPFQTYLFFFASPLTLPPPLESAAADDDDEEDLDLDPAKKAAMSKLPMGFAPWPDVAAMRAFIGFSFWCCSHSARSSGSTVVVTCWLVLSIEKESPGEEGICC